MESTSIERPKTSERRMNSCVELSAQQSQKPEKIIERQIKKTLLENELRIMEDDNAKHHDLFTWYMVSWRGEEGIERGG
jgi:hypothetical protein